MLLTPIHVQTHGNSVADRLKAISFKDTKYKIDPDEAIPSVKTTLEKLYISAAICLVLAIHMMCIMKQHLSSK